MALFSGGTLLGLGLTFVSGVIAARWLGPAAYGQLSLVRSVYTLLAILAPLGLDVALLRHLGENGRDRPGSLTQVRRFRLICAAVNLTVFVLAALWIGPWIGTHVYRNPGFAGLLTLALLALPFAGDAAILSATLRAMGRVTLQNLAVLILQPVVRTAALLGLLAMGFGAGGVVVATALGAAVAATTMAFGLGRLREGRGAGSGRSGTGDPGAVGRVFRYSIWLAGLLLLNNGLRSVDVLVLGRFRAAGEVGQYAALAAIAAIVAIPGQALSQTLAPTVARLHAEGDLAAARAALSTYLRRAILLSSPLFACVAAFGPWLDLVFGARYHFDAALCLVLAATFLVIGCLGQMGVSLTMTGRHRQEFGVLAAGAALAVGLCWLLAPRWGGLGVAVGVLTGTGAMNVARMTLSARFLGGFDLGLKDGSAPLACLALALACRALVDAMTARTWPSAIGAGALFLGGLAALYGLVLLTPSEKRALLGASWRR